MKRVDYNEPVLIPAWLLWLALGIVHGALLSLIGLMLWAVLR